MRGVRVPAITGPTLHPIIATLTELAAEERFHTSVVAVLAVVFQFPIDINNVIHLREWVANKPFLRCRRPHILRLWFWHRPGGHAIGIDSEFRWHRKERPRANSVRHRAIEDISRDVAER